MSLKCEPASEPLHISSWFGGFRGVVRVCVGGARLAELGLGDDKVL